MKTLILTSPHMKGADVMAAQKVLNGANHFDHDYFGGIVDGEFGPVTAQAAAHAKFWMGYKDKDCLPVYGAKLDKILKTGQLSADFAARRARRLADKRVADAANAQTMGEEALAYAAKFVGKHEVPVDSNNFPGVTDWYGMGNVSYCAEGVSRCYVAAGSDWFKAGSRYAYVPYMVADAQQGNGLRTISFKAARAGDPVAFDWDGGVADHVGLFDKHLSPTTFSTIEFNTSPTDGGNQSNGGGCYRKVRNVYNVAAFMRVLH